MKVPKNVGRIDHVAITVLPKNFRAAIDKFSQVLGVTFEGPIVREDIGVQAAIAWDAGLELVAPAREQGPFYEHVLRQGEGRMSLVFGVANFEDAIARAASVGVKAGAEIGLDGDEPWAHRFDVLRETQLDSMFGATVFLGEITPKA